MSEPTIDVRGMPKPQAYAEVEKLARATLEGVPDVHAFPGHIACDARSRSEIVVPVTGRSGQLIAVLDIDSDRLRAFDEVDARALESLVSIFR